MEREGKQLTCDRCGTTVFLKRLENECVDGCGWGAIEQFEKPDKGWLYREGKDLCPACAIKFTTLVKKFLTYENEIEPWIF